jgi:TPR repeat protein
MGNYYQHGKNVAKDIPKAVGYYKKAAALGGAQAQVSLALLYDEGVEVAADEEQALVWYNKAAGQGHEVAMLKLGLNYWKGKGIAQSYERAWKLLNQVRIGAEDPDIQESARAALDKIKDELGADVARDVYPSWNQLKFK